MVSAKLFFGFILILYLIGCTLVHDNSQNLNRLKNLSEKTGIEMIVIDEAEKITKSNASRFLRRMMGSAYVEDPIQSSIRQDFPKNKTVELPGVSFIVNKSIVEELVDSLNKKFAYRNCLAFISDDRSNEENKHTISIIHATDKYNILRHQETTGGSYLFSTDSLITKLKAFEQ